MKIVKQNPLEEFFSYVKLQSENRLIIISPFITQYGAEFLLDKIKNSNVKIRIITNLDKVSTNMSYINPFEPLIHLKSESENIDIKQISTLHAKVYFQDESVVLLGSSNLTRGGVNNNLELNSLTAFSKAECQNFIEIKQWVRNISSLSQIINITELKKMSEEWIIEHPKLMSKLGFLIPEIDLAGKMYEKIHKFSEKKKWSFSDVRNILDEVGEGEHNSAFRKLTFLQDIGLVGDFDKDFVQINIANKNNWNSQKKLFKIIFSYLFKPIDILNFLTSKKERSTSEISEKLKVKKDTHYYYDFEKTLHWLKALSYIDCRKSRENMYSITKSGIRARKI